MATAQPRTAQGRKLFRAWYAVCTQNTPHLDSASRIARAQMLAYNEAAASGTWTIDLDRGIRTAARRATH